MSTENKINPLVENIRLEAETALADYLFEENYITESQYKFSYTGSKFNEMMVLTEESRPGYVRNGVTYNDFKAAWNNIEAYPTVIGIHRLLFGYVGDDSKLVTSDRNRIDNLLNAFLSKDGKVGPPEARKELKYQSIKDRNQAEEDHRANQMGQLSDTLENPGHSIDQGSVGRKSRTGNVERASQLFSGTVYSDISRIPKQRWSSWWKVFKAKTSVAGNKESLLSLRKWTKHFIMGYELERNLFYEIWYNSLDSTFSVHDRYGSVVRRGEGIPVIREAMAVLFQQVAQFSPEDGAILRSRSNDLRAINRDLSREFEKDTTQADREAARMQAHKEKLSKQKEERPIQQMGSAAGSRKVSSEDEAEYDRRNADQAQWMEDELETVSAEQRKNDRQAADERREEEEERRRERMKRNAEKQKNAEDEDKEYSDPASSRTKDADLSTGADDVSVDNRTTTTKPKDDPTGEKNRKAPVGFSKSERIDMVGAAARAAQQPKKIPAETKKKEDAEDQKTINRTDKKAKNATNRRVKQQERTKSGQDDLFDVQPTNNVQPLKSDQAKKPSNSRGEDVKVSAAKPKKEIKPDEDAPKSAKRSGTDKVKQDTLSLKGKRKQSTEGKPEQAEKKPDGTHKVDDVATKPKPQQVQEPEEDGNDDNIALGQIDPNEEDPDVLRYNIELLMSHVAKETRPDIKSKMLDDLNQQRAQLDDVMSAEPDDFSGIGESEELEEPVTDRLFGEKFNRQVEDVRRSAMTSNFTKQMMNNMFADDFITQYDKTKSREYRSVLQRVGDWFKLTRGRAEPISIAGKMSRTNKIRGFFGAAQARSDFIIGFSLNQKIHFEIWYVQEINLGGNSAYASFYIYDVNAEKIIHSDIPFYRNALQLMVGKIGTDIQ